MKLHENLGLQSPQYSDKTVAASQNVFAGSKVKSLKKNLSGPQHFVSVGSIGNPSELRGF